MSWVQTTLGGVCRAKKGGLALHFGVESANKQYRITYAGGMSYATRVVIPLVNMIPTGVPFEIFVYINGSLRERWSPDKEVSATIAFDVAAYAGPQTIDFVLSPLFGEGDLNAAFRPMVIIAGPLINYRFNYGYV